MNELLVICLELVIGFLLNPFKVKAQLIPNFVEQMANVSIPTGRNTMLECTVNNLGQYKVAWLKMDKDSEPTLLAIHTHSLLHDSRFRVSHNNYRQWFLHINNVQISDKGYYMCQINAETMISQVGYLDVLVPPSIVESETSSDTIVDERQKLSLRCRASGYPMPTVQWRREDSKELNLGLYGGKKYSASKVDGEYLNITQVTRDDMGAYLCISSNGVPPSVSKRIIVQVNFRPKIKVQNQLVGAALNSDVHLECRCEASPMPMTSWIRSDGVILLPTTKYQIKEEHDSYRTRMKLRITQLEEKDFGSYKCVAKNTLGEKEGLVRLYEIPTPTIPSHHSKTDYVESIRHKNHNYPHESVDSFHMNLSASTSSLMDRNSHNKHDINSGNNRASRAQKNGNNGDKEMSDGPNKAIKFYQSIPTILLLIILSILST